MNATPVRGPFLCLSLGVSKPEPCEVFIPLPHSPSTPPPPFPTTFRGWWGGGPLHAEAPPENCSNEQDGGWGVHGRRRLYRAEEPRVSLGWATARRDSRVHGRWGSKENGWWRRCSGLLLGWARALWEAGSGGAVQHSVRRAALRGSARV
eukprot:scaffold22131_cov30-Tisochrysis_lutea.AAC.7